MNASLTQKQKRVLAVVGEFIMNHGKSPTLKELQKLLRLKATSSIQRHLDALKAKGYLVSEKYHARGIRVNPIYEETVNIPLVGNIAAGKPLLAQENIEAYIPYDASKLRGNARQYFFLRAVGDSMNRAGINSGDFVLVKSQATANPNEKVVVLIGDEATIKKFNPQNGMVILEPDSTNANNKPIYVLEDFQIQGIVKDVIKKGIDN